jgi:phage regulator Rha-like protein
MEEKKKMRVYETGQIESSILLLRGKKVLLSDQLAVFYGEEHRRLVEQVKRNISRFPDDFMFQLSADEWTNLKSQIAISSLSGHGGSRTPPYAFTEHGVAMLSSVLRSDRAVEVNIEIIRAFVKLRHLFAGHKELAEQIMKLEKEMLEQREKGEQTGKQIHQIFGLLQQLFNPPSPPPQPQKSKIGFRRTQ